MQGPQESHEDAGVRQSVESSTRSCARGSVAGLAAVGLRPGRSGKEGMCGDTQRKHASRTEVPVRAVQCSKLRLPLQCMRLSEWADQQHGDERGHKGSFAVACTHYRESLDGLQIGRCRSLKFGHCQPREANEGF